MYCFIIHYTKLINRKNYLLKNIIPYLNNCKYIKEIKWITEYDKECIEIEKIKNCTKSKLHLSEISCAKKHFFAWELFKNSNYDKCIIIEDDIVLIDPNSFLKNFNKMIESSKNEYNIIDFGYNPQLNRPSQPNTFDTNKLIIKKNVTDIFEKNKQCRFTDSYMINKNFIKFFLNESYDFPIDHHINNLLKINKDYCYWYKNGLTICNNWGSSINHTTCNIDWNQSNKFKFVINNIQYTLNNSKNKLFDDIKIIKPYFIYHNLLFKIKNKFKKEYDNKFRFMNSDINTRNLVFTSAGDNTSFDSLWINNEKQYDVFVIYYGDNDEIYNKYKSNVKFIQKRKGSKYNNFKYFYDNYPEIIKKYDRFFILDDDIIITVNNINKMFNISRVYNLDICSPSFIKSKISADISHKITIKKKNVLLTYTNFVENGVALFNRSALGNLMNKLDNNLIAWGIDYLYIWCNGIYKKTSYAIIHDVDCINPSQDTKGCIREIENVAMFKYEKQIWEKFAKQNNICFNKKQIIEYKNIYL